MFMIKSMTGYGRAEAEAGPKKITVEVRTLNSKQLDLTVKMPSLYRSLEYDLRGMASRALERGKADIYINIQNTEGVASTNINKELFLSYYNTLSGLAGVMEGDKDGVNAALISSILRLPEVVSTENAEVSEEEAKALTSAVQGALDHLDVFRRQEGKILMEDILGRVDRIESYKNDVIPFEKRRIDVIKERIRESVASLGVPVDNNRLEQEMIYYVEKLDITEEKVRLTNHCNYFREVAANDPNPGRKLGFIAQEIGREINTLGSKANDSDIQQTVVKMKDELEKIKEQVLNIL